MPRGKTVLIKNIFVDIESTKSADLVLFTREDADVVSAPFGPMRTRSVIRGASGDFTKPRDIPLGPYSGPCDVAFMARATSEAGNTNISLSFDLMVFDN